MDIKAITGKIWGFGLGLILLVAASIYFISGRTVTTITTNQVLHQQQTIARAEATNITSFFQAFGDSVAVLAQLRTVENPDGNTLRNMQVFVDQWRGSGVIGGVLLLNKDGVVIMNANILGTKDVGADLGDRDYFIWAKTQPGEGNYFIGQSVISRTGASKGKMVTVVASPVFKNGVFDGAIGASVELQPLADRFLGLMKVSDSTDVFLIGKNGDLLFESPSSDKVGTSVLSGNTFLNNQSLSDKLQRALEAKEEGSIQVSYLDPKSNQTEPHLVAYAPIVLANRNWLVVMSSPIQEVTNLTTPIHIRQVAVLILIALSLLFFEYLVIRESQAQKRLK